MNTGKMISFNEAIDMCAKAFGCSRQEAYRRMKKAMASGELRFFVENPDTGDQRLGKAEEAAYVDPHGTKKPFKEQQ